MKLCRSALCNAATLGTAIAVGSLVLFPKLASTEDTDCVVSEWSGWGICSRSCGTGTRKRSRSIITGKKGVGQKCQDLVEVVNCNQQDCNIDFVLTTWSDWG